MKYVGKCAADCCTRVKDDCCCNYCIDRNKCNTKCQWLDEHYDNAGCKYFYLLEENSGTNYEYE